MKYKTKVILYVGIAMLAFIGGAYFIYQQRPISMKMLRSMGSMLVA